MKILDDAVLADRYDVVVVGAGIGGLSAGALLAKKGLKVLVLEHHYIPGGCCTAIRRQDVAMDVGAAMLFGFGDAGYNPMRYVMNELEEEIDMIPHEAIYRMKLEGKSVTFWRDMDRFLKELIAAFPHQEEAIRGAYGEFKEFYDVMIMTNDIPVPPTEIPPSVGMKSFFKHPLGLTKLMTYMFKSEADILNKYISDPKLMGLFDFLTATYTCCNTVESPALLAATMFIDNHVGGACYPSGSPQMLPNTFERAIEKRGGQVVYRKTVEEILIWKGAAYGVRLTDGTEIMADKIISNASIWKLYGDLIRPRHIKPDRMKWAQSFEPTIGVVMLYITVKEEAIPEGTLPIEMLVENALDMEGNNYVVFVPSLDDPSIAPPGKHSMSVICPVGKVKWPRPGDRFYRSEEYNRIKEQEADRHLLNLERMHFPRLRENIVTLDVGTPGTLERYTLKAFGCIGGPKLSMAQGFFKRLKARSDWKNLYCVGDSTSMGEGVISATVSGVGAANRVLEDMGLPIYAHREFPRQYVNLIKGKEWTPPPDSRQLITEENAPRAARECQHCETPECRASCPAGIDTCYFARRIEARNFQGAARVLREVNPLSEICGFICPAERFCEGKCNRRTFSDAPVRIRDLHRWVCGHVSVYEGWVRAVPSHNGKKVAVVGAGPAGLSAAHFLARLGYAVDILDKAEKPGGMLSHAIPSFRLANEVVDREVGGLSFPGMNFLFGRDLGKDCTVESLCAEYSAVFLSPGLWAGKTLELQGAQDDRQDDRVGDALSFLKKYREKGRIPVKKRVLVIGGGSVASDAAIAAKRCGAEEVTLVCLERRDEMPCLASERTAMEDDGVRIEAGWGPDAFLSPDRLGFKACVSLLDNNGKFAPSFDQSRTMVQTCDQIVLAVGQTVEPSLAKYLRTALGFREVLPVNPETMQVEGHPGVYAGGDIVRGAGTVVEAVADGRRAARAMDEWMGRGH